MNRLEELELQIEQLRSELHYLIDHNDTEVEIYDLSTKIDELVVKHLRLTLK